MDIAIRPILLQNRLPELFDRILAVEYKKSTISRAFERLM